MQKAENFGLIKVTCKKIPVTYSVSKNLNCIAYLHIAPSVTREINPIWSKEISN